MAENEKKETTVTPEAPKERRFKTVDDLITYVESLEAQINDLKAPKVIEQPSETTVNNDDESNSNDEKKDLDELEAFFDNY